MKWEYAVHEVGECSSEQLKQYLDNMGQNEWELVAIIGPKTGAKTYIFKRPVKLTTSATTVMINPKYFY